MRLVAVLFAALLLWHATAVAYLTELAPKEHVCHCDPGHGACGCPVCFPKLQDSEPSRAPAIQTRCGDDAVASPAVAPPYLHPASFEIAAIDRDIPIVASPEEAPVEHIFAPDPRPPREA